MTLSDFRFSVRQRRTAAALIRAACPTFIAEHPTRRAQTLDNLELGLRSLPAHVRLFVLVGMVAFDESARLALSSYGRPFRALPPGRARAHFEKFWHSRLAPASLFAKNLMSLLALACYEIPDAKNRLEYHPDAWIAEVAHRRLETWGAEIRAHEEDLLRPDPLVPAHRLTRKVTVAHPAT